MEDPDDSLERTTPSPGAANGSCRATEDRSVYRARACLRCSRSKLRCMRTADPGVKPCARCARLGAECTIPEAKPRGPRRGQGRRVGQLEQKLDGIMSLLTASKHLLNEKQQQSKAESASSTASAPDEARPESWGKVLATPAPAPLSEPPSYLASERLSLPVATPESLAQRTEPSCNATPEGVATVHDQDPSHRYSIYPGLDLNPLEAQAALDSYRNLYLPNFPFVPLHQTITPAALSAQSPLLFRTLMLICATQSPSLQRKGDRWFRALVAERVVVNGEKNLELLQSIVLFVAWCDYRFYIHSKGTSLVQLALGMVMDLGLNKPPTASFSQAHYAMVNEAFKRMPYFRVRSSYSREDMRAMLGCFFAATLAATLFRREHHVPYSEFIDRCCTELLDEDEYPSDKSLVAMVRMQCLVRRAHALLPGAYPCPGANVTFTTSAAMGLTALRQGLHDIAAASITSDAQTSHLLRMQYHACTIAMHEPVIYTRSVQPVAAPGLPVDSVALQGLGRVDALWHCLRAANDMANTFLETPPERVGLHPLAPNAFMAFTLVTATRMLFLQDSDWDAAAARRVFDFPAIAQRMTELFAAGDAYEAQGGAASGPQPYRRRYHDDEDTPLLTMFAAQMPWLRQWYMARTAPPGLNLSLPELPTTREIVPKPEGDEDEHEGQDGRRRQPAGATAEFQIQQQARQFDPLKGAPSPPGDPSFLPGFDAQNADPMIGFDLSYLDTLDDSFWQAFMTDPQMAMAMPMDPP